MSFDMNDAEPQKSGELIPDGAFADLMRQRLAEITGVGATRAGVPAPPPFALVTPNPIAVNFFSSMSKIGISTPSNPVALMSRKSAA